MKKDRNSFFSQYGYSAFNAPIPTNQNMNMGFMGNTNNDLSELDSRISKLEREIQRLDYRISNLENTPQTNNINTNTDYNFANSMYMV